MKMPFAVIETHEKIFIWRLYVCKTLWKKKKKNTMDYIMAKNDMLA